jgi:hypothetical protein
MADQVQEAIKKIGIGNQIEILRQCKSIKERLEKLMEILPGMWCWSPMPARQLVFYLQRAYKMDFGVCDFYTIKEDRQYCTIDGERTECLCVIPEPHCVFRDKDGPPKYPEFLQVISWEQAKDHKMCLGL